MKNRPIKKILSVVLSVLMVLTSLVFVVPEIAPEAEAATPGYYHVKMDMYFSNLANGGHIIIYYYPVTAQGTLDESNKNLKYTLVNSLSKYSTGNWTLDTANDNSRRLSTDTGASRGAIPGWPWKVEWYGGSSVTNQIKSMTISDGSGNGVKVIKDGGWTATDGTRTVDYVSSRNASGWSGHLNDWNPPTVTTLDSPDDTLPFNLTPTTDYSIQRFTRSVSAKDQYGVVLPVSGFEWGIQAQNANGTQGITITKTADENGSTTGVIQLDENVQKNLTETIKDGKLTYRYYVKHTASNVYHNWTVTVNCPRYTANYVNNAGDTVLSVDAGYYGNTFTSRPTGLENTATVKDATNHTVYSWPQDNYSVHGNVTIKEDSNTDRHTFNNWSAADDSNHKQTCTVCEYEAQAAHNFGNWVTKDIVNHTKTCSTCNHVIEQVHNFGNWSSDGDGKNATHTKTCTDCGQKITSAHAWDEGEVTVEAKCATDGVRTYTCTDENCGATYTEAISKTGAHVYGGTYTNVDTDGNGTMESHRQYCVNGDPNCTAYNDTAHSYGKWTSLNETSHVRTCGICQLDTAKEILDHSWDEGKVTTNPDCTTDGERTFTCTTCSATKTGAEPQTGHDWGNYVANADGVTHSRTCQTCRVTEKSASCTFNNYNQTPASCDSNEIRVYTCDNCSNQKTVEGGTDEGNALGLRKATGHNWLDCTADSSSEGDSFYLLRAATCTSSARYYKRCGTCGAKSDIETYNQTADLRGEPTISVDTVNVNFVFFSKEKALGHDFSAAVVTNDDRTHSFKCVRYADCGKIGVGNVEGDTVRCSTTCSSTVIAPTCTAEGYTAYACDICQNKWTADETPMAAHKWISTADEADLVNFVKKSDADCNNKAVYYKECSVCDQSAELIDTTQTFAFGNVRAHDWSDWAKDEDVTLANKDTSIHSRYCEYNCGATEEEKHIWKDEITQAPSYDAPGVKTYTCTVCSATVEEEIEANTDAIDPTVSIKWGETVWNTILNTITFGRYVNYDIALEISASDAETGLEKVEYLVSNEAIADITAVTAGWLEYNTADKLTISKANENDYVVYVKATDEAGNVSYASTDGFVIDTTAPVITVNGVGDGSEYCGNVTVTAEDKLNVTATLDGLNVPVGSGILVNTTGEHTVVITDDAGNASTVTFTVNADHTWTETVLADGSNLVTEANCTDMAVYNKVCSVCGEVSTTETFSYGEADGHEELPAVEENIVKADCENDGSYNLVVYCDICDGVVSSTAETIPAREHSMSIDWTVVTPATCTTDGLRKKACQNTDTTDKYYEACEYFVEEAIPALQHTLVKTEAEAATCGADGNIAYWTCTTEDGCGKLYKDENATEEVALADTVIDALTHTLEHKAAKDASCGVAGNIEYWTCKTENGCGKVYADAEAAQAIDLADTVIDALTHTLEHKAAKAASCGVAGNIEYWYCTTEDGCGKLYKDAEAVLAIEEAATVIEALTHSLEKTEAKDASCGVAGNIEYWTCKTENGCGKVYADAEAAQAIDLADTVIDALTHTLVKTDAVAPDCENNGNIAYWTCTTENGCGKIYKDAEATQAITDTVDPATNHKTQHVEAVSATCTEAGIREHYKCLNGCGYYFSDAAATNKLDSIVGEAALDHNFTGVWSFSPTSNQHQRKCSRCDVWTELADCTFSSDFESVTNTADIHTHKALCECGNSKTAVCTTIKGEAHEDPTCGDSKDYGWTDYSCEFCTNTWEGDIVYLLHKLVIKGKSDGDCVTKGYIIYGCTNEGCDHEATQELSYGTAHVGDPDALTRVTIQNKKNATCGAGGYTGDIVCECGQILRKGTATEPNADDHLWGTPAIETGTCVKEGYQVSVCEDCGAKNIVSIGINPMNHVNVVSDKDVEPTCTEFGYEGATVCSDCGAVVKEGTPVAPLGHKASPWMIITMPSEDGKTPGYAERYCLRCGGEKETRNDFYYDEIHYVVFHNDDGLRLTTPRYYIEGDYTLRPEKTPTKREDAKYTYEFIGWDHTEDQLNLVEKQMAVIAQYKAIEKSYKITFYDANGKLIPVEGIAGKDILYSDIAKAYKGATPTKAATADYTYEFMGWNINCNYETGEATVTPEFRAIPIEKEEEDDGGIFGWFIRWIKSILAKLGIIL